jgi:curved DNA-binding protein
MEYKDYYKILGVKKDASQAEIKSAFRRLAVKYHPDKNKGDQKSEERFKEINEANEVLKDPEKRKKYDQLGMNWQQYQDAGPDGFDFSQYRSASPGGGNFYYEGDLGDLFGRSGGGFSDFFKAFFGGAEGWDRTGFSNRPSSRKGSDYRAEVEISLAEAYSGTTRILHVEGKKLRLSIKPGAYSGQELRIREKGGKGSGGGVPGDIYVKLKVLPDKHYELQGNNLVLKKEVDLYTAVLGGRLEVSTLAGKVSLTVPRGSQNGTKLRLKGKGMPVYGKTGMSGDLIVELSVVIPRHLSEEEVALFSKLREATKRHT